MILHGYDLDATSRLSESFQQLQRESAGKLGLTEAVMPPKRKRAALYLRVSTDGQTVENQRIALEAVCVDGCTDPRKSGAECLNWWGDIGRREALAERHVCDCWIGDGVLSGAMRRCGAFAA
jgi:hypothetical protein